jgi:hypothetical protein
MNVQLYPPQNDVRVLAPRSDQSEVRVSNTRPEQAEEVVAVLKRAYGFPPTFEADTFFRPEDIREHIKRFPEGQFVAMHEGKIVGMATTMLTDRSPYQKPLSWLDAIGGRGLRAHKPEGT